MRKSETGGAVKPLHILIPTELHDRFKLLAKANDRSMAAEVRQAMETRLREAGVAV